MKRIVFIICTVIFSCSEGVKVEEKNLIPAMKISQLSDSTFVSQSVGDMAEKQHHLFFTDSMNGRVVVVDSNFRVIRTIGSMGRGPGELFNAWSMSFYRDSIYVLDSENKISVFTLYGKYSRTIRLTKQPRIVNFVISENGNIFLHSLFDTLAIRKYDLNGTFINQFGSLIGDGSEFDRISRNSRHLYIDDKTLISVLDSEPVIELFSLDGTLIKRIDLSKIEVLSSRINEIRSIQKEKKKNFSPNLLSSEVLFSNACLTKDHLFLAHMDKYKDSFRTRNILVLKRFGNSLIPKTDYYLDSQEDAEGSFSSFYIYKDFLYSYENISRSIYSFRVGNLQ